MSSAALPVDVEAWTRLVAAVAAAVFGATVGLTIWSWLSSWRRRRARRAQLTRTRAP